MPTAGCATLPVNNAGCRSASTEACGSLHSYCLLELPVSHFLQLVLLIALVLLMSKYSGALAIRFGQPAVLGKIALGLLLGPTLLNILDWHLGSFYIFGGEDPALAHTLHDLAELGVLLLMFVAGLETDLSRLRSVGRVATFAALGGVLLPMLSAFIAALALLGSGLALSIYECLFIGAILTATSVSISAQTLLELGQLRSKEGSTILGAAVIDDVVGILILSIVIAFQPAGGGQGTPQRLLDWIMLGLEGAGLPAGASAPLRILLMLLLMAGFFAAALLLGRRAVPALVARFERLPITQGLLSGVLIAGLLLAWAAEWIGGVAAITGTYICGVLLAQTPLRHEIEDKLHTITYALFVPLFFVGIGLSADARPIFAPLASPGAMSREQWLLLLFTALVILLAIAGKVLGCLWGARLAGFTTRESYRVGVGMISRGEVGIIVALVGLNAGIINADIFSIMVLMVLVTTLVTPIWLKSVFGKTPAESSEPSPQVET